jgi:hypothetical protein
MYADARLKGDFIFGNDFQCLIESRDAFFVVVADEFGHPFIEVQKCVCAPDALHLRHPVNAYS